MAENFIKNDIVTDTPVERWSMPTRFWQKGMQRNSNAGNLI